MMGFIRTRRYREDGLMLEASSGQKTENRSQKSESRTCLPKPLRRRQGQCSVK
jgi:hypothetical protein